jgi:hypothetical protein
MRRSIFVPIDLSLSSRGLVPGIQLSLDA